MNKRLGFPLDREEIQVRLSPINTVIHVGASIPLEKESSGWISTH